ncbi:hypothetical protein P4B09_06965 [Lactiplantibacillus plantarum]
MTNDGYPNETAKMMAFRTQFTEWEQGTASQRVVKLITSIDQNANNYTG